MEGGEGVVVLGFVGDGDGIEEVWKEEVWKEEGGKVRLPAPPRPKGICWWWGEGVGSWRVKLVVVDVGGMLVVERL